MKTYLYLSIIPEALIASMLPPQEFGNYMATGTKKRTRGEALFFEVDSGFKSDFFNMSDIGKRCVPHSDGRLKNTLYLSIYRVLENIPLNALKSFFLVTDDGRVLEIEKKKYEKSDDDPLHLYQELAPVTPLIASTLNPVDFCNFITDKKNPISIPKIVFCELMLDELATDPNSPCIRNLPYSNIEHLKDGLIELQQKKDKITKTIIRAVRSDLMYRMVKNGFFIGDHKDLHYYPFPSKKELEGKYYSWWRSAQTIILRP